MRFGLNDVSELPSMEEFEKLGEPQAELFPAASAQVEAPSPETESFHEPEPELDNQSGRRGPLAGILRIPFLLLQKGTASSRAPVELRASISLHHFVVGR